MEKKYFLECCVDSVESALTAVAGGADRLELCSNLVIGGTTPTMALFKEIRKHTSIPIHILIRPRFGDFLYTEHEANIICEEISAFRDAGAEGIVIGSLCPDMALRLGLPAGICAMAGATLGSRMTVKRGAKIIRKMMFIVLILLLVKMVTDMLQ